MLSIVSWRIPTRWLILRESTSSLKPKQLKACNFKIGFHFSQFWRDEQRKQIQCGKNHRPGDGGMLRKCVTPVVTANELNLREGSPTNRSAHPSIHPLLISCLFRRFQPAQYLLSWLTEWLTATLEFEDKELLWILHNHYNASKGSGNGTLVNFSSFSFFSSNTWQCIAMVWGQVLKEPGMACEVISTIKYLLTVRSKY